MPADSPHRQSLKAKQLLEGDVIRRFGRDLCLEADPGPHPVFSERLIVAATVVEEHGRLGARVELNEDPDEDMALVTAIRRVLAPCLLCHDEYEVLHDAAHGQLHAIICEGCDTKASAGLRRRSVKATPTGGVTR
jgi:hypothetical protein